jgi:hypothetical protein
MNRRSVFSLIWLLLFLTACSGAETATPTPEKVNGAGDAAVELVRQQMYFNLTQQAIQNDRIEAGAKATATQQVIDATATQERYQANARETQRADTATQQAWQVTVSAAKERDLATQQAAQAATQQAIVDLKSTQEAHSTATQNAVVAITEAYKGTATAASEKKTQEAPIVFAKQTAVSADAQKTVIELQKTQATMWVSAWGGWVLAGIAACVAIYVVWKKGQIGVIQDENGKVRLVMVQNRALQPDLMPGPVIDFSQGKVSSPDLGVSEATQSQIVHETKIVEAVAALPVGYQRQALGLAGGMASPQTGAQINIQVVQPERLAPVLDEVEGGLLEE